ncbi:MAG: MFS transporter [Candidatus Abyssubacteria bacterium]
MKSVLSDTGDNRPQKLDRNVKALGWVSFLADIHSEAILPLLPLFITQVLGLNRTFLGVIEGIGESTSSLLKVASGWYSDAAKRRKAPTVAGYALSAIAKPMLAFSMTGFHVLAIRFLDRVGKGVRTAPRDALIADSVQRGALGRAFGFHRTMDTMGAVVGTLLAYTLMKLLVGSEEHRIRAIFLLASVFGVAAVAVLLGVVREPEAVRMGSALVCDGAGEDRRGLTMFIGINAFFYLGMFSYAFFLLRAQTLGLSAANVPLIYLFYNIIYAIASFPIGRWSDSLGRKPVIMLAYLSYAVLCFGFAFASRAWHAWALFALYGIHSATVNPASRALIAQLSKARSRGTAMGIYHTSVGLSVLPASIAAGMLWDLYGAFAPFLAAAAIAFIAFVLMFSIRVDAR